jgi:putative transposase
VYLWYAIRDEVAPWWDENGTSAYQDAATRLGRAFANYHAGRAKPPQFRRRGRGESVRFAPEAAHPTDSHHVRVSRIGQLKTYESMRKLTRHLERKSGKVKGVTIARRAGKWFACFSVELTRLVPTTRAPERVIGLDVGLSTLVTGATPDGTQVLSVANPRNYQHNEQRLARAQRVTSRRQGPRKGVSPSNRWKRANARVQKIHRTITNARANHLHQITTRLAKDYDRIVVEDLNISGMVRNHTLAKHISDAAWGEFVHQLEYKTAWYGSALVKVDRFYPSSKTCSSCGHVRAKLALDERQYTCEVCDLTIDRDLNAAINLANKASQSSTAGTHSVAGRRGEVRPRQCSTAEVAHPDEASTEAPTLVGV